MSGAPADPAIAPSPDDHRSSDAVMVFIDGQNLVKALLGAWRTRVHPILLGRHLADGRPLAAVRYYSGVHRAEENAELHLLATRRHHLMRRTGVAVVERELQYHWEWGFDERLPPAYSAGDDERHTVEVTRQRRAREKGIDLALGLDAVTAALLDQCSTIIVVSRDRDLVEVAHEINERARDTAATVEVALVDDRDRRQVMAGYDRTHWIDEAVVAACRDEFDYREELPQPAVDAFLARIGAAP